MAGRAPDRAQAGPARNGPVAGARRKPGRLTRLVRLLGPSADKRANQLVAHSGQKNNNNHRDNNNYRASSDHQPAAAPSNSSQLDEEQRQGFPLMARPPDSALDEAQDAERAEREPLRGGAKAKLARQETSLDETATTPRARPTGQAATKQTAGAHSAAADSGHPNYHQQAGYFTKTNQHQQPPNGSCPVRMLRALRRKRCYVPILLLLLYVALVYSAPYLQFEPQTLQPWPSIPFNFRDGPLRASSASQFKSEHLFRDQISGAESVALDSQGNMYMAIEGGFILYAHLNRSSPLKKHYYEPAQWSRHLGQPDQLASLIKIAELNGPKQPTGARVRNQRQDTPTSQLVNNNNHYNWRRECQADEQIYGSQLYWPQANTIDQQPQSSSSSETTNGAPKQQAGAAQNFSSRVSLSRCSKPLGTRLSPDEQHLYVVDTMSGLFRVHLRTAERAYSSQRLVQRLLDFRANHWVPFVQLDLLESDLAMAQPALETLATTSWANVSLKAVDDLVIDFGAGSKGGDLIYMTVGSQNWPAISFIYQLLEGRSSGLVIRLDTGTNQLIALDPKRMAHVRTTSLQTGDGYSIQLEHHETHTKGAGSAEPSAGHQQHPGPSGGQGLISNKPLLMHKSLGAPRLDENDIFDERPLNFPNGIELTDDRQALLIADTGNKRIIKHHIRGPRRGTSDLWAWTPMMPDNIRRGFDKGRETYWVVGCGRDDSSSRLHLDALVLLRPWPRVRKFLVKNAYLFGMVMEWLGFNVLDSINLTDFGHAIKTGASLCESGCNGMMILQYNRDGEIIRSIHSREFPNDLMYYSQVNELIDANQQEHILYLSSPGYKYVTKLILPTESYSHPPDHLLNPNYN